LRLGFVQFQNLFIALGPDYSSMLLPSCEVAAYSLSGFGGASRF